MVGGCRSQEPAVSCGGAGGIRYRCGAVNCASAIPALVVVWVAVVMAVAVVLRTLTGPLGGLSTARLPQVPAAA
jgi:hypothetical protein